MAQDLSALKLLTLAQPALSDTSIPILLDEACHSFHRNASLKHIKLSSEMRIAQRAVASLTGPHNLPCNLMHSGQHISGDAHDAV